MPIPYHGNNENSDSGWSAMVLHARHSLLLKCLDLGNKPFSVG